MEVCMATHHAMKAAPPFWSHSGLLEQNGGIHSEGEEEGPLPRGGEAPCKTKCFSPLPVMLLHHPIPTLWDECLQWWEFGVGEVWSWRRKWHLLMYTIHNYNSCSGSCVQTICTESYVYVCFLITTVHMLPSTFPGEIHANCGWIATIGYNWTNLFCFSNWSSLSFQGKLTYFICLLADLHGCSIKTCVDPWVYPWVYCMHF